MSDLQTLLKTAAGGPVEPFDTGVAVRTARVRALRRRAGAAVALVLLATALIPLFNDSSRESGFVGRIHDPDRGEQVQVDDPVVGREDPDARPDGAAGTGSSVPQKGDAVTTHMAPHRDSPTSPAAEALGLVGRLAFTIVEPTFADGQSACLDEPCFTPGPRDIHIMDLATGRSSPFRSTAMLEDEATWSPDGSRLAYVATGDGTAGATSLYTIGADGSENRRIVAVAGAMVRKPTWSPDGRIAFLLEPASSNAAHVKNMNGNEIWMVDADGSNLHRIEEIGDHDYPTSPAWSPDGRYLAFARLPWTGPRVFVLDLRTREIHAFGSGTHPSWAPDSKRLAVSLGNIVKVISTETFGGDLLATISREGHWFAEPDWSPDGRWIAFTSRRSSHSGVPRSIWVARPDGADLTPIVEGAKSYGAPSWGVG